MSATAGDRGRYRIIDRSDVVRGLGPGNGVTDRQKIIADFGRREFRRGGHNHIIARENAGNLPEGYGGGGSTVVDFIRNRGAADRKLGSRDRYSAGTFPILMPGAGDAYVNRTHTDGGVGNYIGRVIDTVAAVVDGIALFGPADRDGMGGGVVDTGVVFHRAFEGWGRGRFCLILVATVILHFIEDTDIRIIAQVPVVELEIITRPRVGRDLIDRLRV